MKVKLMFLSIVALAAMASCSSSDDATVATGTQKAYISIKLSTPASTRAAAVNKAGTAAESAITTADILCFDVNGNFLSKVSVATLTATTPNVLYETKAVEVSPKTARIFVVANPAGKVSTVEDANYNKTVLTEATVGSEVTALTAANNFTMTSAGVSPGDGGLVTATVFKAGTAADEAAAKTAAEASPTAVKVNRVVAKVSATTGLVLDGTDYKVNGTSGDKVTIDGYALDATNTAYYAYSELVKYDNNSSESTTEVAGIPGVYRQDPNFENKPFTLNTTTNYFEQVAPAFNWLHNATKSTTPTLAWTPLDAANSTTGLYLLENTFNAAASYENNATKVLFKMKYTPSNLTLPASGSFFRVGGKLMTFDQLATYIGNDINTADQAGYSAFLDKVLGTTRTIGWAFEAKATNVTLADLDAVSDGGYKAATVAKDKNFIQYFQNGITYYYVNIMHDQSVTTPNALGRWGVVRNNWYTININTISGPGTPYVPDPTDPDIHDPQNPDPQNPTPLDVTKAFIDVTITVNPWTIWTQNADL